MTRREAVYTVGAMYTPAMSDIVHARLDPETRRLLERLRRRFGWNDSETVRRALRAFAEAELPGRRRPVVGLGAFASGIDDLGSNPDHLDGFGR